MYSVNVHSSKPWLLNANDQFFFNKHLTPMIALFLIRSGKNYIPIILMYERIYICNLQNEKNSELECKQEIVHRKRTCLSTA